jgi:hypothetical protein
MPCGTRYPRLAVEVEVGGGGMKPFMGRVRSCGTAAPATGCRHLWYMWPPCTQSMSVLVLAYGSVVCTGGIGDSRTHCPPC